MRFSLALLLLSLLASACRPGDHPPALGRTDEAESSADDLTVAHPPDTLVGPAVFLSGKKTAANFIKADTLEGFAVDIHLTGSFAWSSEAQQRALYGDQLRHSTLHVDERYPGIIRYTRWERLNEETGNVMNVNDKVEYYDENGQLLKTIHVDELNPYLAEFPDLINNFYNSEGGIVEAGAPAEAMTIDYRNSTNSVIIDEKAGLTVLIYTLYHSNAIGDVIDFQTTIIALDSLGNEVSRLAEPELYIHDTHITPDGRFLALCTDGMVDINDMGNDMRGHADMGVRIYEIEPMNLIYENRGRYSDGVAAIDESNWIFFRLKNDFDEEIEGDIYLINPVNRIEYKRSFTYDEWRSVTAKWYREWKGTNQKYQLLEAYDFAESRF